MSPWIVMSLALGMGYGALYHLLWGQAWRDLVVALLIAVIGFLLGQILGMFLLLPTPLIGETRIIEGTIMCWSGLVLAGVARPQQV